MENVLLWKLQQDFYYEYERRINKIKYNEITIKELLDLGFNNNYLTTSLYGTINLGWKNLDGTYSCDLSKEQLNVKVKMREDFGYYDDEDRDSDDFVIARVYCVNKSDEDLFYEEGK